MLMVPMVLNDVTVSIEKPDRIYLATLFFNEFSGLLLHPSIIDVKYSRSI